jgi:signal transduction histidine kinase
MKLTILSRLILGYLILLAFVIAVSAYAFFKLHQFNMENRYILTIDNSLIRHKKRLANSVLTQRQYEHDYITSRDGPKRLPFVSAAGEFNTVLTEATLIGDTSAKDDALRKVKTWYDRYRALVEEEATFARDKQDYQREWYEHEKVMTTAEVLKNLELLEDYSWQDISNRLTLLAIIVDKTGRVSKGIFERDLKISSPPEMKKVADAFNLMCGRLETLDKMKSEFFSTVSHELRMPLVSMREGTNLLFEDLGDSATEKQKELLAILSEEGDRVIELVNSLLDLSKMEAGMLTYDFQRAELVPLIEQSINELRPLAQAKGISIETQVEGTLPSVKADTQRILQVLRNLIGNAVRFTPDGGSVRVLAQTVRRGIKVSVADTGPGIPEEALTIIFNKFQQMNPGGASRVKGTGLGLAIVKNTIESHGGTVWAESKQGEGSRFIFTLPA